MENLNTKEDNLLKQMEEQPRDEMNVGENGEHDCNDGTDGTANIDGTNGQCTVCGLTDLI